MKENLGAKWDLNPRLSDSQTDTLTYWVITAKLSSRYLKEQSPQQSLARIARELQRKERDNQQKAKKRGIVKRTYVFFNYRSNTNSLGGHV